MHQRSLVGVAAFFLVAIACVPFFAFATPAPQSVFPDIHKLQPPATNVAPDISHNIVRQDQQTVAPETVPVVGDTQETGSVSQGGVAQGPAVPPIAGFGLAIFFTGLAGFGFWRMMRWLAD